MSFLKIDIFRNPTILDIKEVDIMAHNYWTATAEIKEELGGKNPTCPECRKEMFPQDDHGRFKCWSCGMRINLARFSDDENEI